jgi:hypothetical protein
MKNLTNFTDFLNESRVLTHREIIQYITDITPDVHDVPDYFFELITKSGKRFRRERVKIEDLVMKDESLREYVMSGESRYIDDEDYEPHSEDIYLPIVIFNGEVIDGYNRTAEHYRMGSEYIDAYVSI